LYYALSSLRPDRRWGAAPLACAAVTAAGCGSSTGTGSTAASQMHAAAANPNLDPGSPLGGRVAPNFTLTSQFGQQISLSSFRGKVVAQIAGLGPTKAVTLPALPTGSVTLGPGTPHLVVFFATWLDETSDLQSELTGLSQYVQTARADGLPGLTAVDQESSEPSLATVRRLVAGLAPPLSYPVALDETGRLADGYGVQDQPWFVLTSASGAILWHHDGWLPESQLVAAVQEAAG
jgi:hypothetical protein